MIVDCLPLSTLRVSPRLPHTPVRVETDVHTSLGELRIRISNNYYDSFRRPVAEGVALTAEEYLQAQAEPWGNPNYLCPEMPLDKRAADRLRIHVPGGPPGRKAVALLHAGRRGCIAPVHFDWDHEWVAHACLTGRKRFFFFPPDSGWLLNPIINTSSFAVPRYSGPDLEEFCERTSGAQLTLEAGQGVLFPSLYWHGVAYDAHSLSVSVRFGQPLGARPFAALPRFWLLQRLLWSYFRSGFGAESNRFLAALLRLFFKKQGWRIRYRETFRLIIEELLNRGESRGVEAWMGDNFVAESCLASREVAHYYTVPRSTAAQETIKGIQEYLFEGIPEPAGTSQRLAAYALSLRQGLKPQRGVVELV